MLLEEAEVEEDEREVEEDEREVEDSRWEEVAGWKCCLEVTSRQERRRRKEEEDAESKYSLAAASVQRLLELPLSAPFFSFFSFSF